MQKYSSLCDTTGLLLVQTRKIVQATQFFWLSISECGWKSKVRLQAECDTESEAEVRM